MKNNLLLILFSIFGCLSASAFPNMIVEHYTTEHGLSNNIVNCSLKDRDGFIWFGTWYGLCSFDGIRFKTYNNRHDIHSDVPPQKIQRIVEDRNGVLWLKTIDRKLYIFDKTYECFHAVYNDLKEYTDNTLIAKMESTPEGDLLLLTMNKTLLRASTDTHGKVHIEKLYEENRRKQPTDTPRPHILNETKEYINWVSRESQQIASYRKGKVLRSKPADFISRQLAATAADAFSCATEEGQHLWLGDVNGRIYRISPETGAVQLYTPEGIHTPIRNLVVLSSGTLYISTDQGIYEYNIGYNQLLKLSISLSGKDVSGAFTDKYDKIWFREANHALVYYDPLSRESRRFDYSNAFKIGDFEVQDIGEQGIFFLTATGELFHFDRETLSLQLLNKHAPFDDNQGRQLFFNLMLDPDGILWISSTTNGVYRVNFPKRQFSQLTDVLSLPAGINPTDGRSAGVRALFQTRSGDIWVGTRWQEVIWLDRNGKVKELFTEKNFRFGPVYHILEDSKGNLWFSTKGNGLVRAQPDVRSPHGFHFTRYTHEVGNPASISSNDVYCTFEDSQKRIWVATLGGGLNLLCQDEHQTHFKHRQNGLSEYPSHGLYMEVRTLTEDKQGRIWVGTMDGLMSFDSHFAQPERIEFETYRERNESPNVAVNDIYVLFKDSQSQIWVSVFGGGLHQMTGYDKEKRCPLFHSYGAREGMSNEVVMSVTEDREGNLWIASESGLSCFNKQTQHFRNYGRYDGFPNVKLQENSILYTLNGELWLGGNQEIVCFKPQQLETRSRVYPTFIVDFKVSNRPLTDIRESDGPTRSILYADAIELNHNQSMFTIEFAALNYYNPGHISYRYILQGYEEEWHYNSQNRIASYTNVPPGRYVFRVETLDEAGADPVSFKELPITILPPWWKTGWAYTLYTLLSLACLCVATRLTFFFLKMKNDVYIEQQLTEMKIKFFTNISHELRTPLTLIKGPIQELKARENFSPKSKQYVELMERNTDQMLQLVNQILDLRKIQSGKMRLHVSPVCLNKVIETFRDEFRLLAKEKEINYTLEIPQEEELKLWADKEKLCTVVRNVIANAFKFTPAGGSVTVSIEQSADGNRCFIRVADSGTGIATSKLSKIFERFVQDESAQTASQQGTGIGLALAKEIVDLHHGEVRAESPGEQGALFIISLPTGKEHFKPSEVDFYADDHTADDERPSDRSYEPVEPEMNEQLPTLLLVDDNKDLCRLIKLELEDKFNIHLAGNGVEGLRKVHLYHPDLIVTDQMMPGMDGMQLLQHIREDFQISHIPVIMLTARNDEEAKTKAILLGANSYITKPFSKEYLLACIGQLLKERRQFHDRIQQHEHTVRQDSYEQFLVKKDTQLLDKIHRVIEENMDNSDFNIDTIAVHIGLSRSGFFKKLKSLTGLAPVDLVKEIRLTKSVELIKNTDMGISEIAFAVGFKDSSYYSKCFRKKYDLTPREYINQWRKSDSKAGITDH